MPALGRLLHGKADLVEGLEQAITGPLDRRGQRLGIRTVALIAVERDAARLGRKRNQRSRRGLHLGKTARCRTRPVVPEGIVATGVEQHEVDPRAGFFHLVENSRGADRLRKDVGVAGRMGVDRNQIVEAVYLHAVAGMVEQRDVGADQFLAKF